MAGKILVPGTGGACKISKYSITRIPEIPAVRKSSSGNIPKSKTRDAKSIRLRPSENFEREQRMTSVLRRCFFVADVGEEKVARQNLETLDLLILHLYRFSSQHNA